MADKLKLQPAYDYITPNIRNVDKETLIFYAAVTWDDPIPVGFDHPPNYDIDRSVFAFHYYHLPNFNKQIYFTQRTKDAQRLSSGLFLTEFERPSDIIPEEDDDFIHAASVADEFLVSWTHWPFVVKQK